MGQIALTNAGFETGDFTGWTQFQSTNTIVSSPCFRGQFAYQSTASASTGGALEQAFAGGVTYPAGRTLWARCYFNQHNVGGTDWDFRMLTLGNNDPSVSGIDARTDVPAGSHVIRMFNSDTSTWSPDGTFPIQYDTWYRLELRVLISPDATATGESEVRLYDASTGVLLDSVVWSNINTAAGTGHQYGSVSLGPQGGVGAGARTFQVTYDEVAVSDSGWLGPVDSIPVMMGEPDFQWLGGDWR